MMNGQMELSLENGRITYVLGPGQRRISRATWWFARMRQIVDRAIDWQPAVPARPEQMVFPGSHREVLPEQKD